MSSFMQPSPAAIGQPPFMAFRGPRISVEARLVLVEFAGRTIAKSTCALCVQEEEAEPAFFVPRGDVQTEFLRASTGPLIDTPLGGMREWAVIVGDTVAERAAWSLEAPATGASRLRARFTFDQAMMSSIAALPASLA